MKYKLQLFGKRLQMMKDPSVLQEAPFTDQGTVVEVFTDFNVWMGIRNVIESINDNEIAA